MFHKLKLKLTMINVLVVGILLVLYVFGTYFIMQMQIFNQSQQLMQIIAREAGSGSINISEHNRSLAKYFYLKTDASGKIMESSSDVPLSQDLLAPLANKTIQSHSPKGEIELHDETYTYLKVPINQTSGFIMIFVNLERDREILRLLLGSLSVGGLICLILAYYGSRFMADRAMAPIKESWQRQQDFVADASHELRTPLTVVQVNLELLQGNPEETVASQSKWLDYSLHETKRMSKLVDDLLFLARADSQQLTLEIKQFPLHKAFQEVIESFKPLAENNKVSLEFPQYSEIMFTGDENRLKQLLVILLDNALKYTPCGGQVTLNLQNLGSTVEITVSDTGEGIKQEHLAMIFERFYRVDKARSQQKEGTGLGLAIADWIIKSHHGRIRVTSSSGKGTAFVITLPHISK